MLRKINLWQVLSLIIALFSTSLVFANNDGVIAIATQPQQPIITPAAPNLDAKAYILIDAASGKVLAEKDADVHMAPASLTKLMSLYIISSALKNGSIHLDDKVRISTKAWQTPGSRMFVKAGDEVPVSDLMKGIIVASGNDATVAMAEYVAGTEEAFTNIMNDQAKKLGMNNSHFLDSTGLPNPDHYSTAHDMAILAAALAKYFPNEYKIFSEKWFVYKGIKQPNRNRLLWRFQYADGLKTGHTAEAGFCLVASAMKDGMRLISVIMGAPNDQGRTEDSIRLLTYGYRFFETHKVYSAATPVTKVRVWKGTNTEVPVGVQQDLYITSPTGQFKNMQTKIVLNDSIKAPITKGQILGTVNLVFNNQVLGSAPLIALEDNAKGGFWRRMSDTFHFGYSKIFSRTNEKANNG